MNRKKIGLVLFSIALIWAIAWGVLGSIFANPAFGSLGHIPPLFGIGGTLILLLFFGILWLWSRERMALKDASTTATDLKLAGYVFMLMITGECGIRNSLSISTRPKQNLQV